MIVFNYYQVKGLTLININIFEREDKKTALRIFSIFLTSHQGCLRFSAQQEETPSYSRGKTQNLLGKMGQHHGDSIRFIYMK